MASIWGSQQTSTGGLNPKGGWNADTNTPTLFSGVGMENDYYIVNVGGNTNLDGTSVWVANDWAIFSNGSWRRLGGGLTAGISEKDVLPVLANGQTLFTLSTIPGNPNISLLNVNGLKANYGIDYTIAGTTLTWLNTSYNLETTDRVEILY
jgi:hypothetical protein